MKGGGDTTIGSNVVAWNASWRQGDDSDVLITTLQPDERRVPASRRSRGAILNLKESRSASLPNITSPQPGQYEYAFQEPPRSKLPPIPMTDTDDVEHLRNSIKYKTRMRKTKKRQERKRGQLSLEEYRIEQEWKQLSEAKGGADLAPLCGPHRDSLCLVFTVQSMAAGDPQRETALLPDPYGDGEAIMRPAIHVSVQRVESDDESGATGHADS